MNMDTPSFFQGPDELELSRQMLQLMGKELKQLRGQLADKDRENRSQSSGAGSESIEIQDLRRRLRASEDDNDVLRRQLAHSSAADTEDANVNPRSHLRIAEATITRLEERIHITSQHHGQELEHSKGRIIELEEELARLKEKCERKKSAYNELPNQTQESVSHEGLDWSPKTTANFDDKSNEAFLNSLQLYERSSVNDMAKCGNLKVALKGVEVNASSPITPCIRTSLLLGGPHSSSIVMFSPSRLCTGNPMEGGVQWSDSLVRETGNILELFDITRHAKSAERYCYLGTFKVIQVGPLKLTQDSKLGKLYTPILNDIVTQTVKTKGPKEALCAATRNAYKTGELTLALTLLECIGRRGDIVEAMGRRRSEELQSSVGTFSGKKRAAPEYEESDETPRSQKTRKL